MWDTRTKESDSPNHWGWKTPLQVILPNSVQAGSPREGRPGWLLPPRMWSVQAVPVLHCPHSSETFSIHWLLFCHRSPLKIAWLHLLYCLHSDIHALWWVTPLVRLNTAPFIRTMFQPLNLLCGPSVDCLQHVFVLGKPELHPVVQMWSHQCWTEGRDHISWPAWGNTPPNEARDT